MQEGQQVVVGGTIDVFERDGRYQLYAKSITLDGAGQLYERFEQLKRELAEQGLFAPEYKQPIPRFIRTLGVVTAPVSCDRAGRAGACEHCQRNTGAGTLQGRCDDCRAWRRFH